MKAASGPGPGRLWRGVSGSATAGRAAAAPGALRGGRGTRPSPPAAPSRARAPRSSSRPLPGLRARGSAQLQRSQSGGPGSGAAGGAGRGGGGAGPGRRGPGGGPPAAGERGMAQPERGGGAAAARREPGPAGERGAGARVDTGGRGCTRGPAETRSPGHGSCAPRANSAAGLQRCRGSAAAIGAPRIARSGAALPRWGRAGWGRGAACHSSCGLSPAVRGGCKPREGSGWDAMGRGCPGRARRGPCGCRAQRSLLPARSSAHTVYF